MRIILWICQRCSGFIGLNSWKLFRSNLQLWKIVPRGYHLQSSTVSLVFHLVFTLFFGCVHQHHLCFINVGTLYVYIRDRFMVKPCRKPGNCKQLTYFCFHYCKLFSHVLFCVQHGVQLSGAPWVLCNSNSLCQSHRDHDTRGPDIYKE